MEMIKKHLKSALKLTGYGLIIIITLVLAGVLSQFAREEVRVVANNLTELHDDLNAILALDNDGTSDFFRRSAGNSIKYCRGQWSDLAITCMAVNMLESDYPKWLIWLVVYGRTFLTIAFIIGLTILLYRITGLNWHLVWQFLRGPQSRKAVAIYISWSMLIISTDNFAFRNGIKHWEYDDEAILYLFLLPAVAIIAIILWNWSRAGSNNSEINTK